MEQQSQPETQEAEQQRMKTLGVRLDEDIHARLSFIAQLTGSTITDEIRRSIEARIEAAQADPELVARAATVQAEIEREAQARQQAIAGFFGKVAVDTTPAEATVSRTNRRTSKPGEAPTQP